MLNPIQIRIQCCVFVIKPLILREIVKMVLKCLKIPTKSTRMAMLLVHLSRRQLKISSHWIPLTRKNRFHSYGHLMRNFLCVSPLSKTIKNKDFRKRPQMNGYVLKMAVSQGFVWTAKDGGLLKRCYPVIHSGSLKHG